MYLSVGFGSGIYATIDVDGWGRYWQFLGEDQSNKDVNPPRHIVPEVVTQPRGNFYDPAGPWGGVHPSHHAIRPERSAGDEELETPQHPEVKHEGGSDAGNPTEDADQEPGHIGLLEPEVRFTEMVGVEEGGEEEDVVDYSLGTDPITDEAEQETGRVSRSRVKDFGLDPLHDLK